MLMGPGAYSRAFLFSVYLNVKEKLTVIQLCCNVTVELFHLKNHYFDRWNEYDKEKTEQWAERT